MCHKYDLTTILLPSSGGQSRHVLYCEPWVGLNSTLFLLAPATSVPLRSGHASALPRATAAIHTGRLAGDASESAKETSHLSKKRQRPDQPAVPLRTGPGLAAAAALHVPSAKRHAAPGRQFIQSERVSSAPQQTTTQTKTQTLTARQKLNQQRATLIPLGKRDK